MTEKLRNFIYHLEPNSKFNSVTLLQTGIFQTRGVVPYNEQLKAMKYFLESGHVSSSRAAVTSRFMQSAKVDLEMLSALGGYIANTGDWQLGENALQILNAEQNKLLSAQRVLSLRARDNAVYTFVHPSFLQNIGLSYTRGSAHHVLGKDQEKQDKLIDVLSDRLTRLAKGDTRISFIDESPTENIWEDLLYQPITMVKGVFSEYALEQS